MVMGDQVQGDITFFNPDIQLFQNLNIDGGTTVESWEHGEMDGDGFSFLVYHTVGSRDAVILKKTSRNTPYTLYCTYQVPVGKSVKSFSFSTDLDEIVILTNGGAGSNIYYYTFDKNGASGVIST
jgi:hypothetical protein